MRVRVYWILGEVCGRGSGIKSRIGLDCNE